MSVSVHKIREDFDRIARLTAHDAIHPSLYDAFLLQQIPNSLVRVLEVGCGIGEFSRALANRGHQVIGIDLSPEMIRVARERCVQSPQITFVCGDFTPVAARTCHRLNSIATPWHNMLVISEPALGTHVTNA